MKKKLKVNIYTLGCRLNTTESESIAEKFQQNGFDIVHTNADINIINSCTVTSKAEQKLRRLARDYSKNSICIITGCAVKEENKEQFVSLSDNVLTICADYKYKLLQLPQYLITKLDENPNNSDMVQLYQLIKSFLSINGSEAPTVHKFDFNNTSFLKHKRAYLKIQDGCDRFCSYCAVSLSRGEVTSLEPDEIIKRFDILQQKGFKEICLTGVNLALYNYKGKRLSNIIDMISPMVNPNVKIRLTSLEPDLITDNLIESLSRNCVAEYFHIPLQSASKRVLEIAKRSYDEGFLRGIVSKLRTIKKNPFISADILTGLPGESDEDAEITYNFLREEEFSFLHVFPFSKREGTAAYNMKAPEQRIRDERAERLRILSRELYYNYASKFKEKLLSAICEAEVNNEYLFTADNYLKIIVHNKTKLIPGERYDVKILSVISDNDRGATIQGVIL